MRVTREAVFETNSSSSHSISIHGGGYACARFPLEQGKCVVHPGEFGWGPDRFYEPEMKASYCLTYVKTGGDDEDGAREVMLCQVLENVTGCDVDFVPVPVSDECGYRWGYIDHQSHKVERDVCAAAFESEETLQDFIFNPASVLIIDNDNY